MKTLITGGAGFVGFNAVKSLKNSVVFDNFSKKREKYIRKELESLSTVYEGDLKNQYDLEKCFKENHFDGILHLGAQTAVTTSISDPRTDFESNATGTFNLLEAVRKYCPKTKLIYSSTNKVYGSLKKQTISEHKLRYELVNAPLGITEEEPLDFYSPYGCSKGAADQYITDYSRTYGLNTFVLRQSCIYGPHQSGTEDQGWISWFIQAFLKDKPLTIYGNGKQVRDILHVKDLISLYEKILQSNMKSGVYNIGGGKSNSISLLELCSFLNQKIKQKEIAYKEERLGDQKIFYSDNAKANSDFGWTPKIESYEGITEMIKNHENML